MLAQLFAAYADERRQECITLLSNQISQFTQTTEIFFHRTNLNRKLHRFSNHNHREPLRSAPVHTDYPNVYIDAVHSADEASDVATADHSLWEEEKITVSVTIRLQNVPDFLQNELKQLISENALLVATEYAEAAEDDYDHSNLGGDDRLE